MERRAEQWADERNPECHLAAVRRHLAALGYFIAGVICCLLIITIPFGIANLKLIPVSLAPLGKVIVPSDGTYLPTYR